MGKVMHVHTVGVQKGKSGRDVATYDVKCVLAEEPLAVFPSYRGADFSFRVFVEEDVEGHAGFHEGGFYVVGAIVYGQDGCGDSCGGKEGKGEESEES